MSLLAVKLARDVRRQWLQFGGVALTLALGVAVFGATLDSYDNLKSSYSEIYERLGFADTTVTGGDVDAIAGQAARLGGVTDTETRLQADVPFQLAGGPDGGGESRSLLGRLVGQPAHPAVNRLLVQDGTGLDSAAADGVVAERHTADHFRLAVGDSIEVFAGDAWHRLRVAGIAVSPEYLWPARDRQDLLTSADDFGVLFVPDSLLAELNPASANHQTLVRYAPGADRRAVDRQVREIALSHGASDVMPSADQPSNTALQQDVEAFRELSVLFPALFLIAAALTAYVLLSRLVRSQRAEIGTLAANGYPARRLLRHYLAFGAVAGLGGAVLGAAGGVGLARLLTRAYTSSLDIPLAVARFHPLTPLVGIVIGTTAGVVAAVAPARVALRVTPAEAMHGVAPTGVGRRSLLERIPGLSGFPVRARFALRNVERTPRRAASTVTGVALAAVLVLSSLGMLDTVALVLDRQFHVIQRQDAQLYLATVPDRHEQAAVDAVAGVAASEPLLEVPVVLTAGRQRYQSLLSGFEAGTTMHHFPHGLPAEGLLLGSGLRSLLGVEAGGAVDVTVGDAAPVAVPVAGFVDEPLGSLAYATLPTAQRLAGGAGLHSLLVRYDPGVSLAAMRDRLGERSEVLAYRDVRGSEQAVRQLMELFYTIVGVMLVFGSVLAFVMLFNTLSANVAERTVELATLRAAGSRLSALARMLTGENLLLVVAAIPVGLTAGWLTARWFMSSFNTDLYHFALRLRVTTPLLLAAGMVVIAVASHLPVRRNVRRLDIARIVRERAL